MQVPISRRHFGSAADGTGIIDHLQILVPKTSRHNIQSWDSDREKVRCTKIKEENILTRHQVTRIQWKPTHNPPSNLGKAISVTLQGSMPGTMFPLPTDGETLTKGGDRPTLKLGGAQDPERMNRMAQAGGRCTSATTEVAKQIASTNVDFYE